MKLAPDVLPPAFYPVGLNLAGRRCVVIGARDDREAIAKARDLRAAGADVVRLEHPAAVREEDVRGAALVVATPRDERLAARLRDLAVVHRFLLCAIDQPAYGNVALPATVAAGPLRAAISTGGVSPRVGGVVRAALQEAFDATFVRFMACLAHQRRLTRARHAGDAAARRAALLASVEGFEVSVRLRYPDWFVAELAALRPRVVETRDER
jgi:siroheme synthase (precorrin-2 oxidase/ferrochelatase)